MISLLLLFVKELRSASAVLSFKHGADKIFPSEDQCQVHGVTEPRPDQALITAKHTLERKPTFKNGIILLPELHPMKKIPTLDDIETLTAFLPRLYADGFSPIERWSGGEKQKDGSFSMPYPAYSPVVDEFFRLVSGGWLDYEYNPEQAYQMLKDENFVKNASLPQIKSMLTFCVRGERFSDGHWGQMIEKGYIRRLLERLNDIKSEQAG